MPFDTMSFKFASLFYKSLCFQKDVESESAHAKKQARGSTSTKRSRAAEVHNLSERVGLIHFIGGIVELLHLLNSLPLFNQWVQSHAETSR